MSEENKNKGSWGCFIFVFILLQLAFLQRPKARAQ